MMQDHLRPDLGMYIELDNEAWHGKFFGGRPKNSWLVLTWARGPTMLVPTKLANIGDDTENIWKQIKSKFPGKRI